MQNLTDLPMKGGVSNAPPKGGGGGGGGKGGSEMRDRQRQIETNKDI